MLNWLRWREHYRPDNSLFGLRCSSKVFSRAALEFKERVYVVSMQTLFMQWYVSTYSNKVVLIKKQFFDEKFEVFENYYF